MSAYSSRHSRSRSPKKSGKSAYPSSKAGQFQGRNTFGHDGDLANEDYPEYPYNR